MIDTLILEHSGLVYFSIALISLLVGSLLNVIIHRLPIMLKADWAEQCNELLEISPKGKIEKINLFFPRSFCPQCKTMITAWQNIPVLSFLLLRGQCHSCKTGISWRYPSIELLTMCLSLFSAWHFGLTLPFLFSLPFIWGMVCLIFIDFDEQLLPDGLTLGLLWLGLIANTQQLFTSLPVAVLSAAGAYLLLWLFIQLFYLITGKIGMGHGDFKLFSAMGAWFGWTQLPLILILSSISGAISGLIYLKWTKQSKDTAIPFGPFLCISGLISLFFGESLVNWYLHFYQ